MALAGTVDPELIYSSESSLCFCKHEALVSITEQSYGRLGGKAGYLLP